jgi:chaperonin cofactor prefoldin
MANDPGGWTLNPLILWERLKASFAEFITNLGAIFAAVAETETVSLEKFEEIHTKFEALIENFEHLADQIKNFEFQPHWNSRVIHVPTAVTHIKELYELLFTDFRDRIDRIATPFKNFATEVKLYKQEMSVKSVDSPNGATAFATKLQQTIQAVNVMLDDVITELDELQDFEDLLQRLTDDFEHLDDLFLKQGNPKIHLPLEGSGFVLRRIGGIHKGVV